MMNSERWRHPLLDSSFHKVLGIEVDLWSITAELGTALSDSERTWPELGFWWWFTEEEQGEGEDELKILGYIRGGEVLLYATERGGAHLGTAERPGGATELLPRSGG
jgi:hypothetical protein